MLSKRQRLTKTEFDSVFKNGKRLHSPTLQLIYIKNDSFHGAVVVGKKVYKKAVDRNQLRRQIYGVLYRHQKKHEYTGTYILIAKPALKALSKTQCISEVTTLLTRAVL